YGMLLAKNGAFDIAVEHLEKAIKLKPTEEKTYFQLITVYQQQNNDKKVLQVVQRLTTANPRSIQGRLLLAHLLEDQGKKKEALVLWELSRNTEALNVLLKLQEAYPDSEQVLYLGGLAYEKVGDFASALSFYERIVPDSSFFLPANFQSLRVMEMQKRYDLAY